MQNKMAEQTQIVKRISDRLEEIDKANRHSHIYGKSLDISTGIDETETVCDVSELWDLFEIVNGLAEALQALGGHPEFEYCYCLNKEQIANGHTGECKQARAALEQYLGHEFLDVLG